MDKKAFKGTRLYNEIDYSQSNIWDDDMVDKLIEGATIGCNKSELACLLGVSRQCLYDFLKYNPALADRVDTLRHDTSLRARINVRNDIVDNKDIVTSKWYLERKECGEFSISQHVDIQSDNTLTIKDKQTALHDALRAFTGSESDSKPL